MIVKVCRSFGELALASYARVIAIGALLAGAVTMTTSAWPARPNPVEVEAAVRLSESVELNAAAQVAQNGDSMSHSKTAAVLASIYGASIVIADPAVASSKQLAPAIEDLRRYLGEITGTEFTVGSSVNGFAIALSLAGSPQAPPDATMRLAGKGLEAFLIRGSVGGLDIVANDVQGLSHGIYYYLEELGVRWLLPTAKWTIVPHRSDIRVQVDQLVEPAFKVRSYFGTGGFYALLWGRKYGSSVDIEFQTTNWQRRLRYGGEYVLGGHVGVAFIRDPTITAILQAHPDYLAKVGGTWSPLYVPGRDGVPVLNDAAKINAGNPDAVALFCGWVLNNLRKARKSPDSNRRGVVSVEPSDGYFYGDNFSELPGNGSGSDQSFYIANVCARTVRRDYPDASVSLLAYAGHAAPPSFPLEPNVIVQLAPYAFQDTQPEQFIALWKTKAPRLALYDYWSIPDWSNEEPTFNYLSIGDRLRFWHANGIEGLTAESSYGAGAMGLSHYVAAHLMWTLDGDERAIIDSWYENAFGSAKVPMKRMLERWAASFKLSFTELSSSYRDLSDALSLVPKGSAVYRRILDYGRYLHYLRLRYELESTADSAAQSRVAISVAEYLLDINDTLMVDTPRMIDLYRRRFPMLGTEFSLNDKSPPGPGWARIRVLSDYDIAGLIQDGTTRYPVKEVRDPNRPDTP